MALVTLLSRGEKTKIESSVSSCPEIFEYSNLVYYGIFFSSSEAAKLYDTCSLKKKFFIRDPHMTLAHCRGEAQCDEKFISEQYEKCCLLKITGFVENDDVVLALVDEKTAPVSQLKPHITLWRSRPLNLKTAAEECMENPTTRVDLEKPIYVRGTVRAWSTAEN